jgi:beta-1,4-N-acetylglucosaminyltransferase
VTIIVFKVFVGSFFAGRFAPRRSAALPPTAKTRTVFVTVGTTRFDALVAAASHPHFLAAAGRLGYDRVLIQHGHGPAPAAPAPAAAAAPSPARAALASYSLKPDIGADVRGAALVVSHAGAGSVFEALRSGRRLLVACNPALAGNHQRELAGAMAQGRHCAVAASPLTPEALAEGLARASAASFAPLPAADPQALLRALAGAPQQQRQRQGALAAGAAGLFLALLALLLLYSRALKR